MVPVLTPAPSFWEASNSPTYLTPTYRDDAFFRTQKVDVATMSIPGLGQIPTQVNS